MPFNARKFLENVLVIGNKLCSGFNCELMSRQAGRRRW
jgi:hypothetical protein